MMHSSVVVPDLNEDPMIDNMGDESGVLLPYVDQVGQNQAVGQIRVNQNLPLMLYGTDILKPCTKLGDVVELNNQTGDSRNGAKARDNLIEMTLSLGSDPFNLDPFIFGDREGGCKTFKQYPRSKKGSRRLNRSQFVPPNLGKRVQR